MPPTNMWPFYQGTGYQQIGTSAQVVSPIWNAWNQNVSTGSTGYIAPNGIWQVWNSGYQTVQQTGSYNIWLQWNQTAFPALYDRPGANPPVAPRELSPEEKARRARENLIWKTRSRSRAVRTRVAERKAKALLREHLSDEQLVEYETDGSFTVETADGARRYRIGRGIAGNVRLLACREDPPVLVAANGRPIREGARFCAHVYHPDGDVPVEDNQLAQKLLIEAAEEQFLAMANVS